MSASSSSATPSYNCGRCRQPLTLRISPASTLASLGLAPSPQQADSNSSSLQESQYDLLASRISLTGAANGAAATSARGDSSTFPPPTASTSAPVTRKVVAPTKQQHVSLQQKLFNALSAQSEVDHPLCAECADAWFASMNRHVEAQRRERDLLLRYEKEVREKLEQAEKSGEQDRLRETVERLKGEEDALVEQLLRSERRKEELAEELAALDREERELAAEEAEFWLAHGRHLTAQTASLEASRSLLSSYTSTLSHLEKLQRTNVYADTFCIGHDGGLATINGLRLGRLPNVNPQVEWSEINAAWGMTALLLVTVARKLGVDLKGYRVVPVGSFSRVEKLEHASTSASASPLRGDGSGGSVTVMELYGSGDWALGRLLQNRRFDSAMVAFLECLRQVIEFAEDKALEQNEELRIPHHIHKDKIGDVSIRVGSSDETWTRALRHVLLDLKILLADSCR